MERIPIYLPDQFNHSTWYFPRQIIMKILRENIINELQRLFDYNKMATDLNKPTIKIRPSTEKYFKLQDEWVKWAIINNVPFVWDIKVPPIENLLIKE